jgi:hypothetical protein
VEGEKAAAMAWNAAMTEYRQSPAAQAQRTVMEVGVGLLNLSGINGVQGKTQEVVLRFNGDTGLIEPTIVTSEISGGAQALEVAMIVPIAKLGKAVGLVKYGRATETITDLSYLRVFSRTALTPNPYTGVQEASAYLRAQGVPREVRKQILESFDLRTIGVRQAGASEYGVRYFDNVNAFDKGRYLVETFPASRASLALDLQWNRMTNFTQWQIRPGATLFEGVASPQGVGLRGGQIQKFVPNLNDLLSP